MSDRTPTTAAAALRAYFWRCLDDDDIPEDDQLDRHIAAIEAEARASLTREPGLRGECGFNEPHEPHEYVVAQNGKPVDLPCPGLTREPGLDAVYRERNAVVAALIRTNGWRASLMAAPDAEGWWVVYAETPQGQVSWHIHPTDVRLFDDVPRRGADWDGHDTDTKYERVAALRAALASEDRP